MRTMTAIALALATATAVPAVAAAQQMSPPVLTEQSPDQVLSDKLRVMDATAIVMCRDNDLPLVVFNLNNHGDLIRLVRGDTLGTAVGNQLPLTGTSP